MAIRTKGNKFQVDVTVSGVRAPRVSCDTMAEAKIVEAQFKAHLMAGGDPADLATEGTPKAPAGPTLGELLSVTYKDRWAGAKAEASSLRNGTVWPDELGHDLPVASLTPDMVTEVCDRLAVNGNSAGTINRKLAALSLMLGVGEDRGWCRRFKLPRKKEYVGRLRYFSDAEVEDLLDYVARDHPMLCLFSLAVETGMRQGELLGLTRRDIDLDNRIIHLGETKGNQRRGVPLTQRAMIYAKEIVKGLRDHEKVFPDRITSEHISRVIRAWKPTYDLPQDDEACFHTFRHTTCSRMVQRGVPIVVVQKWMGHASIQTTMRYAHLATDSLNVALAALNERNVA
jgi:integrase